MWNNTQGNTQSNMRIRLCSHYRKDPRSVPRKHRAGIFLWDHFFVFLLGKSISKIDTITIVIPKPFAQELKISIIFIPYLYIIAPFDIFKTNVVPIININDIAHKIPKNILKMSPICSNKLMIFSSAIGCTTVESNL